MTNGTTQIAIGITADGETQFSKARFVDNSQSELLHRVFSYVKQAEIALSINDVAIGFRAIKLMNGGNK